MIPADTQALGVGAAAAATVAAVLAGVAAYVRARLKRHASEPTVVELLEKQNSVLTAMHEGNLSRIRELETRIEVIRNEANAQLRSLSDKVEELRAELIASRERIGYLTGQLVAKRRIPPETDEDRHDAH